nr:hypothetical protein [Ochrobactrum sp. CM-21-5]
MEQSPVQDFDPDKPMRVVGEPWAGASGEASFSALELSRSIQ